MTLSSTQRETAIIAVLQSLHAVHPMGLTARDLLTPVRLGTQIQGLDEQALTSLLHDMKERLQVQSEPSALNAAVLRWKRTETGRALLESMSLLP